MGTMKLLSIVPSALLLMAILSPPVFSAAEPPVPVVLQLPAGGGAARCEAGREQFSTALKTLGRPLNMEQASQQWSTLFDARETEHRQWKSTKERLRRSFLQQQASAKQQSERLSELQAEKTRLAAAIRQKQEVISTVKQRDSSYSKQIADEAQRRVVVLFDLNYDGWGNGTSWGEAFRQAQSHWMGELIEQSMGVGVSSEARLVNGLLIEQRAKSRVAGSVDPRGDAIHWALSDTADGLSHSLVVQSFTVSPLKGEIPAQQELGSGIRMGQTPRMLLQQDQLAEQLSMLPPGLKSRIGALIKESNETNQRTDQNIAGLRSEWQQKRQSQNVSQMERELQTLKRKKQQSAIQVKKLKKVVTAEKRTEAESAKHLQQHQAKEVVPLETRLSKPVGVLSPRDVATELTLEACRELMKKAKESRHSSTTTVEQGRLTQAQQQQGRRALQLQQLELFPLGYGVEAGERKVKVALYGRFRSGGQVDVATNSNDLKPVLAAVKRKAGDSWTDPYSGIEFVWIPAGEFKMGSPSSEPERDDDERQHRVKLTEGYWLGKYEVTQGQWKKVMGNNPANFTSCGSDCPVEKISWEDTQDFIRKLNGRGNGSFKLPSEAQWEYAARAGTTTPFSFGDNITTSEANYDGNYPYNGNAKGRYRQTTVAVGSFPANSWGLHEMHGNVWEWVNDWYGKYPSGTVIDPEGPSSGRYRVLRGGSWSLNARHLRSAGRDYGSPSVRHYNLGVRLVRQP